MKNIVLIFIAAVVMASCSGSAFMKRKYTKGNYNSTASKATKPKVNDLSDNKEIHTEATAETVKAKSAVSKVTKTEEAPVLYAENKTRDTKSSTAKKAAVSNAAPTYKAKNIESVLQQSRKNSITANKKSGTGADDTGGIFILMVILCFIPFLCLIPVWRHDGKKATLNFWLTLILHLTFIGYIIYSLLVILNVVDLS